MAVGSRWTRWALVAFAVWTTLREIQILSGVGDGPWFSKPAYWTVAIGASLLCASRGLARERRPWLLIGAGGLAWALGDVYFTLVLADLDVIPVPTPADVGYLSFVPLVFAGLCWQIRITRRGAPGTLWVDGLTAALAAGSVSAAIVLGEVLNVVGGGALSVATNLAYPVGDLILLGTVLYAIALGGWRLDRTWAVLGFGIALFWVADSIYLVTVARETYHYPGPAEMGWTGCLVSFAVAAWQPVRPVVQATRREGLRVAGTPIAFATLGLGVLVVAAFTTVNPVAVVLAALSLLAVLARLLMTLADNHRMLRASRQEALTDALTGLGNRRALIRELERRLDGDGAVMPFVLVLFDLDGFKHYNDSFGHPSGDALLERLGAKLGRHCALRGSAYRMGGDEFCAVLDGERADGLAAAAAAQLGEHGEGFVISASFGAIALPGECADADEALRIADQRMYAHKNGGRPSARSQSKDVLLRVLAERNADLGTHGTLVADLAGAVARELGLDGVAVEAIAHAAELHDIGKVAIPDAILSKPSALDEAEWAFMRRHTIIGERIVAAAPALSGVAELVRSSHERWTGGGYPDDLSGEQIPLGARIVAVCDAYDAMTTDRPYRVALSSDAALAELRRCAGEQFDPAVVRAFIAVRRPAVLRLAA